MPTSTELVAPTDLPRLVRERDEHVRKMAQVHEACLALGTELAPDRGGASRWSLDGMPYGSKECTPEKLEQKADLRAWRSLLARSPILDAMPSQERARMSEALDGSRSPNTHNPIEPLPRFTEANVLATIERLRKDAPALLAGRVAELFSRLNWNRKTNDVRRFGPKLIAQGQQGWHTFGISSDCALIDLETTAAMLLGKPVPTYETSLRSVSGYGKNAREYGEWIATPYGFSVRLHKNGSTHVRFDSEELRSRLNELLVSQNANAIPREAI